MESRNRYLKDIILIMVTTYEETKKKGQPAFILPSMVSEIVGIPMIL